MSNDQRLITTLMSLIQAYKNELPSPCRHFPSHFISHSMVDAIHSFWLAHAAAAFVTMATACKTQRNHFTVHVRH